MKAADTQKDESRQRVRIRGLKEGGKNGHLNGTLGWVNGFDKEVGRYVVILDAHEGTDDHGVEKLMKESHLEFLPQPQGQDRKTRFESAPNENEAGRQQATPAGLETPGPSVPEMSAIDSNLSYFNSNVPDDEEPRYAPAKEAKASVSADAVAYGGDQ